MVRTRFYVSAFKPIAPFPYVMSWLADRRIEKATKTAAADKSEEPRVLGDFIKQDMKAFEEKKKSARAMRDRLAELTRQKDALKGRVNIRARRELDAKCATLQKEIEAIEANEQAKEYAKRVQPYLRERERQSELCEMEDLVGVQPFFESATTPACAATESAPTKKKNSGLILGKFIRSKGGTVHKRSRTAKASEDIAADFAREMEDKAPPIKVVQEDQCEDCGEDMIMVPTYGILSCPSCGTSRSYMDTTSASVGYGEEVEYTSFSYQRVNHFNEWLTFFQGKENSNIPDEIVQKVMKKLYDDGIRDASKITTEKVHKTLQHFKLRQYYKQVTLLWCTITGNPPPRMTPQQEEQCRIMFNRIQEPFERHKPKNRRNFLSYSYCLFKFNELLGHSEFLRYFPLLKGADKLDVQDDIFEKICKDMNWEFKRSR